MQMDTHDEHSHHAGHHGGQAMPTDMPMDNNCTSGGGDHMMMMYFHTGYMETILFSSWSINSLGGLLGSCIGIFCLAIIYEALKYFREYLFKRAYASVTYSSVMVPGDPNKVVQDVRQSMRKRLLSSTHFLQTALHVVQVCLSYFLMLIFMTYNVWLCLAVILGAGVGFFIFGWKKTIVVDITEHCH